MASFPEVDTSSGTTTASELPPEIISHVVICLINSDTDYVNKRGFSACSLTCRYWAESIIPALFRRLTLRNAKDVAQLKAFLDAPHRLGIPLAGHIYHLTIEYAGPQACPWLHHLPDLWKRVPDIESMVYIDNASVSLPLRKPMSSHLACGSFPLPRSLPPSYYTPIRELSISNLVLDSKAKLFTLTDCLPELYQCEYSNITFRQQTSGQARTLYRRPLSRRSKSFRWVKITGCEDGHLGTQTALGVAILEPHKRIHLATDIWKPLSRIISALTSLSYCSACVSRNFRENGTLCFVFKAAPDNTHNLVSIAFDMAPPWSDPHIETRNVTFIHIRLLGSSGGHEFPAGFDITSFEDALHELDNVPPVEIRFEVQETTVGFRWLLNAVLDGVVLNRFSRSSKLDLRYACAETSISMNDVLSSPSEYAIDDSTVVLSALERFDYLLFKTQNEKDELLRAALARLQAPEGTQLASA